MDLKQILIAIKCMYSVTKVQKKLCSYIDPIVKWIYPPTVLLKTMINDS